MPLRKVSTQFEEEVLEEEVEVEFEDEYEDEEEAWGWEAASRESYGSEGSEDRYLEEGALETPGMLGSRRGERVAVNYTNECLIFRAMETSSLLLFLSPQIISMSTFMSIHIKLLNLVCHLLHLLQSSLWHVCCILMYFHIVCCLSVSSLIYEI